METLLQASPEQPKPASIRLSYQEGSSDKVYNVVLQQCETGWSVIASWGRRGSTLTTAQKAQREPFEVAKTVYDRIVSEKRAKGYQGIEDSEKATDVEGESRKPAASVGLTASRPVSRVVVFAPELLTRITERELKSYIRSPRHWFQWKRDGERLTICTENAGVSVHGYNKLGMVVPVEGELADAIQSLCNKFNLRTLMIDGEIEGSGFWAYDLLQVDDHDFRNVEYRIRFETLEVYLTGLTGVAHKLLHLTQTAKTDAEKAEMIEITKQLRIEGICVKLITATHRPGRAGQHLKHKYEATGSFIVGPKPDENDGKRTVGVYVIDKGIQRRVATVKIPDCYPVPEHGKVIEVRYLYAYPNGGIVQPCVSWDGHELTLRPDVLPSECIAEQLKFKADADAEAAA
jgi:bifunctional non-homologous end joining protein LigD